VVLVTVTVCEAGSVFPAAKLKLSAFGVAERLVTPLELAFKVTGMVTELEPGPATLMKPTSVPEVGPPEPIETVSVAGVAAEPGVTWSQPVSE